MSQGQAGYWFCKHQHLFASYWHVPQFILGGILRIAIPAPFTSGCSGNLDNLAFCKKLRPGPIFLDLETVATNLSWAPMASLKSEVLTWHKQGMTNFDLKPEFINALAKAY